jgi:flagellar FliJ protein
MHAFHFRLESLLKYRRQLEEQSLIRLASATAELLQEQELLNNLQEESAEQLIALEECQQGIVTVAKLKMLRDYNDKLKEDIILQKQQVDQAAARRQLRIDETEQAMKDRKLVEKLREKRLLQYQKEMLLEEQKELDELGLQIFSRNS